MRRSLADRVQDLEEANQALEDRRQRMEALQTELIQRDRLAANSRLVAELAHEIRNPITGAEHRARIDLPDGFEYAVAEIASGSSKVQGPIPLDLNDSHGQFAYLHLNNQGVVRA